MVRVPPPASAPRPGRRAAASAAVLLALLRVAAPTSAPHPTLTLPARSAGWALAVDGVAYAIAPPNSTTWPRYFAVSFGFRAPLDAQVHIVEVSSDLPDFQRSAVCSASVAAASAAADACTPMADVSFGTTTTEPLPTRFLFLLFQFGSLFVQLRGQVPTPLPGVVLSGAHTHVAVSVAPVAGGSAALVNVSAVTSDGQSDWAVVPWAYAGDDAAALTWGSSHYFEGRGLME